MAKIRICLVKSLIKLLQHNQNSNYPYFWKYQNFVTAQRSIRRRNSHGKNELNWFVRFDRTPTYDRHRQTQTPTLGHS